MANSRPFWIIRSAFSATGFYVETAPTLPKVGGGCAKKPLFTLNKLWAE